MDQFLVCNGNHQNNTNRNIVRTPTNSKCSKKVNDSIDLKDFRGGIIGNWAKLLLGMVTLTLDTAFFVQHYVLYYEEHLNTKNMESQSQYKLLKKESVQLHEYGAC